MSFVVTWGPNIFGFADFIRGLMFLKEYYPTHQIYTFFESPFDQLFESIVKITPSIQKLFVREKSSLPADPSGMQIVCNIYPSNSASMDFTKYFTLKQNVLTRIEELTPKYPFISVHFRSGDKHLRKNGKCAFHDNLVELEKIEKVIDELELGNVVFHTDNFELKEKIKYKTLKITPVHVADCSELSENLINTVAEFFVISKAEKVFVLINSESSNLPGRFSTFAARIGGKELVEILIS